MSDRDDEQKPAAAMGADAGIAASLTCARCGTSGKVQASHVVWAGENHNHWHCRQCGHAWSMPVSGPAERRL